MTDRVQVMSLNILPNCDTVLHGITRNFEFLKKFLDSAQSEGFVVPFIENLDGNTALHSSTDDTTGNPRSTEYFLTSFLCNMPFDHHGRAISDCIPKLVE